MHSMFPASSLFQFQEQPSPMTPIQVNSNSKRNVNRNGSKTDEYLLPTLKFVINTAGKFNPDIYEDFFELHEGPYSMPYTKVSQDDCLNSMTRPLLFGLSCQRSAISRKQHNFHLGILNTLELLRAKKHKDTSADIPL